MDNLWAWASRTRIVALRSTGWRWPVGSFDLIVHLLQDVLALVERLQLQPLCRIGQDAVQGSHLGQSGRFGGIFGLLVPGDHPLQKRHVPFHLAQFALVRIHGWTPGVERSTFNGWLRRLDQPNALPY